MRATATACLIAAVAMLASACGPTCQDTCRRFYDETECNAPPSGIPSDEAVSSCTQICQEALQVTGEDVAATDRRFDPEITAPLNASTTLANEQEAAAWMDCVGTFTDDECYLLDDQYCAKIF
jgi:hypothetical protein